MNQTSATSKQKQMAHTSDLMRSFKATTNLASGLTKDRIKIQHDLQKISHGKEQLEELKKMKKTREPILTAEEKASKVNKHEIKGTGFNLQMFQSEKGQVMIENQRDSRRQRHIEALKECEKFVEQFYDNFSERKNEIKERAKIFFAGTDSEIERIMAGLSDELLLANEIQYVNGIWEKVGQHRQARKEEIQHMRASFDDLRSFQKKGSGGYLESMRANLINIAFFLEPEVDKLIKEWVDRENEKYTQEHRENDLFYQEFVTIENEKFDSLYQQWKDAVVRFHLLKQEDAISRFLTLMESKQFVNPQSRVDIFLRLKEEQSKIFSYRMDLIRQMDIAKTTSLTKDMINQVDEKLKTVNDEAQNVMDEIVDQLNKDMENTNEDADIALYDLKDFLQKNDAQLEWGQTFDMILEERATPTVERRKLEGKTLILDSVKYMEDFDFKMNEISQNMVNFFKELATKVDANMDKLKQTDIGFQVALAQCGDHHEELAEAQEDLLKLKVEEMRKAIHHVELNERLQQCFEMLDQITRTYRNYNAEYIKIVEGHPQTMDGFFRDFEKECMLTFKMHDEAKRQEIQAMFQKETEDRQRKLEETALKKYEEEKKLEELKKAEDDKGKPAAAKGKAPPPQKKGKEPEKPQLDVPKLEVPKILEYESSMGNKYLIERSMEEISTKLMDTNPEPEQPNSQDGSEPAKQPVQVPPTSAQPPAQPPQTASQLSQQPPAEAVPVEEPKPKFRDNDYLTKANQQPPEDPDGMQCLHKDLLIIKEEIARILLEARDKCIQWLCEQKANYAKKVLREGKDLIDKNVDELDENLRKQWPRKGRLEVEIYQERKSQVTAHNKKYERQVRSCLEKYNLLEEQWEYVVETIEREFGTYQVQQDKLIKQLPDGKNLAELQGVQRKEKDSCQTFEEKCREYQDKLHDIGITQPEILVTQNTEMLAQCKLFEKGGDYSKAEIQWYKGQMKEINEMIEKCKAERDLKLKDIHNRMEKLMKQPYDKFEKDYKGSIHNLSAKEGLGKTFGQPRRLAQERLRSEMTKCESAQKGVDQLFEKLRALCQKSHTDYGEGFDFNKEKQSLSMEIRVTMVSLIRCIVHYGTHLSGFIKDPKVLQRLTYSEKQAEIELQQSELPLDEGRKAEELEHLGSIGFKNANTVQLKFPEMVVQIEKQSKEMCVKLYTGENAKYLVGPEKIPEYLTQFLEGMRLQAEGFRIGSVRQLREMAQKLVEFCQEVPSAVFSYLNNKYTTVIRKEMGLDDKKFTKLKREDDEQKERHLKLFRPNLENPANKQLTMELNQKENERSLQFKEVIDETQLRMLDIEQDNSVEFQNAYLNNLRGLIKIYDCLLYKEDFILLPGDEIVEKKHYNIKVLTAQAQKQDILKKPTRKWPGLGASIFEVDFASMFEHYKDFKADLPDAVPQQQPPVDVKQTELSHDLDIPNTDHHKQIVKARNDNYQQFKMRFENSVKGIMERFDSLRKEELRFNSYWAQNLKEITQKHI